MSEQSYVIPSTEMPNTGSVKQLLASALFFGIVAAVRAVDENIFSAAAVGFVVGFFVPIPFYIVIAILKSFPYRKHRKAVWAKHTFNWYRDAFPEHAHANGHVSCRHCGSHKTQVRNLMERTYMRLHSCSQCGETLYFSPEKL